ncbi:MAG: hypothetical protein AAGF94_18930 [Pseudomonadota bacterium]
MWTPKLDIIENTLETPRDSYVLSGIQGGLSVRRPFLGAGIFVALASAALISGFADMLYPQATAFYRSHMQRELRYLLAQGAS